MNSLPTNKRISIPAQFPITALARVIEADWPARLARAAPAAQPATGEHVGARCHGTLWVQAILQVKRSASRWAEGRCPQLRQSLKADDDPASQDGGVAVAPGCRAAEVRALDS